MWRIYLEISRPRFWLYLLGPFLIGAAAANRSPSSWFNVAIFALYFSFPANFLLYGVNDLFDYETDKRNPKKHTYELLLQPSDQRRLIRSIWLWNVPLLAVWLVSDIPRAARWGLLGFVFLSVFYSAHPIRAKSKPFLDSLFNILYLFPALVSYGLIRGSFPPFQLIVAAALWCMAMHAYSAVPDIVADKKAGISTIATWLGARRTLLFCLAGYLGAAILSYKWLGGFSLLAGFVYGGITILSLLNPTRNHVFKMYRWFPLINLVMGAGLFFWVLKF